MKKRVRHLAEQIIVKKLRDSDAMLLADKSVGEVLQSIDVNEALLIPFGDNWRFPLTTI